jgi:hypothetical protein
MKKILALITLLILYSCTSYEDLRSDNRYKITTIRTGNTLDTVVKIMGVESSSFNIQGRLGETIRNPYKSENINYKGNNYLIYYYYTERKGDNSWETAVTPIIFLNDVVTGIGWRSMEQIGLESPSKTIKVR